MPDWSQLRERLREWGLSESAPPELPSHVVCAPSEVASLQEIIRLAAAEDVPIYPYGGATALGFGRPATREGIGLCTRRLDRVIDYPARDMTITVEAGVTMSRLAGILAEEHQRLPVEAPQADRATLGGVLATNTSGPRRYGFGTMRDYVIGISAVDAEGTLFKAGGRVVKNVAGYDICKLLVGSLGTLAVVTQMTLKVRPMPEATALIWAGYSDDLGEIDAVLARLATSVTRPVAIELLNRLAAEPLAECHAHALRGHGAPYVLVVGFEGSRQAVDWQVEQIFTELALPAERVISLRDERATPLWEALIAGPVSAAPELSLKVNIPSSAVCEFLQLGAARGLALHSHAGNGIVEGWTGEVEDGSSAGALLKPLREWAAQRGGNVIVWRCPDEWKSHLAVWGEPRADWPLMRGIKQKLDPKGILNPGRFIDGI